MHRPSVNVPIDVEGGLYSPLHDAENDGSAPEKAGDESKDLEVTLRGLSSAEAAARLERHGRNEIPEEVTPWYVLFFKQFVGTMPVMLEIACVLALIIRDYPSFGMIVAMLVINASLGFYEEQKAQASLDGLRSKLAATVSCVRDGTPALLDVALLVPGDVISLRGGNAIPADVAWLEGDTIKLDTAALTGEPIPWSVPRPDKPGEPGSGRRMLSGCTLLQGECMCVVECTGLETEIGQAAALVNQAAGHHVGLFESKILALVKAVIAVTLLVVGVVFVVQFVVRREAIEQVLKVCLGLVVGAVPIALPLVLQVTMALGAGIMAENEAIVTHTTALQEIASMTVLNSDKTGTLTTARMSILHDAIWARDGFTRDDALTYAALASNAASLDDAIDTAVFRAFRAHFGEAEGAALLARHHRAQFVGFNPTVKRAVAYYDAGPLGPLKVAKGIVTKIIATGDDGGDCWSCERADAIRDEILEQDAQLSSVGYKTIAVAVARGDGPMRFVGLVPMIDPPREDTKETIRRVRRAGVDVKMCTGDHLNIAKETARLIELGTNIRANTELWPASFVRDELVHECDGFAQVMPKDKREVVLVLQRRGLVVGMTGDGVNDAAALAQAQVGIAVDGATDAAKNAADMILTTPGLSAIYTAVYESRKIFQRLRAYVLYRMAATIQIVLFLTILIFACNEELNPLYVILLALLNDVSMTPIAYDRATPSPKPEIPTLRGLLATSLFLGSLETLASMIFFEIGHRPWLVGARFATDDANDDDVNEYQQVALYLQISIAVELLILSCRTPHFFFLSRPSGLLLGSVMSANLLTSLLCRYGVVVYDAISWGAIGKIWLYDLAWFVAIDALKVGAFALVDPGALEGASLAPPDRPVDDEGGGAAVEQTESARRSIQRLSRAYSSAVSSSPSGMQQPRGSSALRGSSGMRSARDDFVPRSSHTIGARTTLTARSSAGGRASRLSAASAGEGAQPIRPSLTTTLRPSTPGNYAQLLMHTNWRLTDA